MNHLIQKIISIILLIIFAPILMTLSILIFFSDGLPILFIQNRLGRSGKIFKCMKFRSMKKNAENILKNDPELMKIYVENGYKIPEELETRYLGIGLFLRKSSLDELPQLINVLKGDMNLVGPRPIVPDEISHYKGTKKDQFLSMRPGMTGLWQISGRSNIDYPERVDFEISYLKKRSFLFDIYVLFKTLLVVFKKEGAH